MLSLNRLLSSVLASYRLLTSRYLLCRVRCLARRDIVLYSTPTIWIATIPHLGTISLLLWTILVDIVIRGHSHARILSVLARNLLPTICLLSMLKLVVCRLEPTANISAIVVIVIHLVFLLLVSEHFQLYFVYICRWLPVKMSFDRN